MSGDGDDQGEQEDQGRTTAADLAYLHSLRPRFSGQQRRGLDALLAIHDTQALTRVQELDLSHSTITDRGLSHLRGIARLRRLDLSSTDVCGEGLAHLHYLPGLESLDLGFTKITDAGLAHLPAMSRLRTLGLSHTGIGDAGVAHLGGLTGISGLRLRATQVGDDGLRAIVILRTRWEDRTLQAELVGYEQYTQRVRFRLIPGVW